MIAVGDDEPATRTPESSIAPAGTAAPAIPVGSS